MYEFDANNAQSVKGVIDQFPRREAAIAAAIAKKQKRIAELKNKPPRDKVAEYTQEIKDLEAEGAELKQAFENAKAAQASLVSG